ncbi:sensor histidine kinase [Chryseobacterium sp. G0201]|uniref:sensor histidine kinase n=1 Tax=Chryseobacterium sp. G0201 TaxID=2487065 RepID=UPI000F508A6B|nr:histidine kinase [Chryseobacterium sp. G0201]AZA52468.1 histidine kinase [Chryseobacterium sp. G0201]
MKANKLIFLHIFFWGIYIIGSVLIPYFVFHTERIILNITFFLTSFICFYVNYFFVAPNFFDASKWYKSVIAFLLSASCFVLVRYSVEEILLPATVGFRNYKEGTNFGFYFFDNIFYSSTTIFISTTFWFFKYFVDVEKEKAELIEARKTAELQALKTQINPHFIFNSLNNIYSLVYQKSDKALPAIEELSQLLRYSTKDLEKDVITLDKEIGYIDSLTALEKLRLKKPELLTVEKNINHPKLNISPMILVPFVENAFKHGDFREKGFDMKLSDDNQILHFYLLNFKKDRMKDSTSGIGIDNVKKRLEILYPKKHELNINESETEFVVDLKIDLRNE